MKKIIILFCYANIINAQTVQTMKRLPDTGQSASFTNTFGEDNDYTNNAPAFVDNGNGTITDTVTTLMWQGTDGGEMTIENAITYCDTLTIGGHTNWRLPTAQESFSILNLQNNNPALNTVYFTNTNAGYWWTSETQANDATKVWCTNAGGGIGNHPKSETISAGGVKKFHARAVRDAITPAAIPAHFTDNNDGTITDNITQLMWQKTPIVASQTWEQALSTAENLLEANYTDWRLPNIKELQSLNDETLVQPSVTAPYFTNYSIRKYWSSTSLPNQTTKAWYWQTTFGITTYDEKTIANNVVCVRNSTNTITNIKNVSANNNINVYPNPFIDYIHIQHKTISDISTLTNSWGTIIYIGKNIAQQNFSYLASGIYYLHINNSVYKLIKQ